MNFEKEAGNEHAPEKAFLSRVREDAVSSAKAFLDITELPERIAEVMRKVAGSKDKPESS